MQKIINVWRFGTNAKRIFRAYERLFGVDRARLVCKKLPQRALRERWGAIHTSEADLTAADESQLPQAWNVAFGPFRDDDLRAAQNSENAPEAELGEEDLAEARKRMVRWRFAAFSALSNADFWRTIKIASHSRQPFEHFRRWLLKNTVYEKPVRAKEFWWRSPALRFICMQAEKIYDRWDRGKGKPGLSICSVILIERE